MDKTVIPRPKLGPKKWFKVEQRKLKGIDTFKTFFPKRYLAMNCALTVHSLADSIDSLLFNHRSLCQCFEPKRDSYLKTNREKVLRKYSASLCKISMKAS